MVGGSAGEDQISAEQAGTGQRKVSGLLTRQPDDDDRAEQQM